MDELKPCPFCGYEPVIEHWTIGMVCFVIGVLFRFFMAALMAAGGRDND